MNSYKDFEVGDRVMVSTGEPRPPERFNRKLAAWKNDNYTGWVEEIREPREYSPHGELSLKRDDYPDKSWITFTFVIPLGGRFRVDKIKEAA